MRNLFTLCLILTLCLCAASGFAVQIVDSTGGGDHTTIAAAVAAASNGEEIQLAAGGPYNEEILLGAAWGTGKDNLTFTNPGACVWAPPTDGAFGPGAGSGLVIGAGITQVTLQGITMDGSVNTPLLGIMAAAPITLNLDGTTITGFSLAYAIGASDGYGAVGGAAFGGSPLTINMTNGASVYNNAVGLNLDINVAKSLGYLVLNMSGASSIDGNVGNGILLNSSGGANAFTLTGNSSISSNGGKAIEIVGNATGANTFSFTGSTVAANTGNALHLTSGSLQTITVDNCDFVGNQRFAAMNSGAVTAVLSDTDFSGTGNADPKQIINVGNVTGAVDITATNCDFNQATSGFWVHPPTDVGVDIRLTGCTVTTNTAQGILAQAFPTSWTMTNCTLDGNGNFAMNHEAGGTLYMLNTTMDNNSPGGPAGGYAGAAGPVTMVAENCSFSYNGVGAAAISQQTGLLFWNPAAVLDITLTNCDLVGNYYESVLMTSANSTVNMDGCTLDNLSNPYAVLNASGAGATFNLSNTTIRNSGAQGAFFTGASQDITMDTCTISGCNNTALQLAGADSDLTMTNCTVDQNAWGLYFPQKGNTIDVTDTSISSSTVQNISIVGGAAGASTMTFTNCDIYGSTGSGLELAGTAGTYTIDLVNSTVDKNGTGLYLGTNMTATYNMTLDNTSVDENTGHGLFLQAAPAPYFTLVAKNGTSLSNNGSSGIYNYFPGAGRQLTLNLTDCFLQGNNSDSAVNVAANPGGIILNATNTDFSGNSGWGFVAGWAAGGAPVMANLDGCNFNNNGAIGFETRHQGGNINPLELTANNCHFDNNAAIALEANDSPNTITLTNCSLDGGTQGLTMMNGKATLTGCSIDNSGTYGVNIWAGGVTDLDELSLTDTTINNCTGRGLSLAGGGGDFPITFTNVTVDNATSEGLYLFHAGARYVVDWTGGAVTNCGLKGIYLNGQSGSEVNLTNVNVDGNGQQGIHPACPSPVVNLDSSTVDNNGLDGIYFNSGAGVITLSLLDSSVSNNSGSGIYNWQPGAAIDFSIIGSNIDNNGQQGLWNQTAIQGCDIVIEGSTFNGNGHGFLTSWWSDGGLTYWETSSTISLKDSEFSNNTEGSGFAVGFYANEMDLTAEGCTFSGNAGDGFAFNPNGPAGTVREATLSTCTFEGNNSSGVAMNALGTQPSSLTSTLSVLHSDFADNGGWVAYSTYANGVLNLEDCQADHTAAVEKVFTIANNGFSTTTLTVKDSDFLTTGRSALQHTSGTLIANFEGVTIQKAAGAGNPNWFLLDNGTSESAVTFDQCTFYNGDTGSCSGVWLRDGGQGIYRGTLDVTNSIISNCGMYNDSVDHSSQDYNLLEGTNAIFAFSAAAVPGATWVGGENNRTTADALFISTTFGNADYLRPEWNSRAASFNSDMGSDPTWVGAKEPAERPTAALEWSLY